MFLGHYVRPNPSLADGLELVIHNTSRLEFFRDHSQYVSRWSSAYLQECAASVRRGGGGGRGAGRETDSTPSQNAHGSQTERAIL